MAISAQDGPFIEYGPVPSPNSTGGANPDVGPSMTFQGDSVLDPQTPYQPGGYGPYRGHIQQPYLCSVDCAPPALSTVAIAASQAATAVTALTLVAASGAGIVRNPALVSIGNGSQVNPLLLNGGVLTWSDGFSITNPAVVLVVQAAYLDTASKYAYADTAHNLPRQVFFDPTVALARNVTVTTAASETSKHIRIYGADVYGNLMSEDITCNGVAATFSGKKAFKLVYAVRPPAANTFAGNVSIGTGDVIGFNYLCRNYEYMNTFYNGGFISSTTGYVLPDVTNPATQTTGDVRGTYALQSASDGTKRLTIWVTMKVADLLDAVPLNACSTSGGGSGNYSAMFGQTQA